MSSSPVAFALLRPGVWGVAVGDQSVGRVLGDHATGFQAVLPDGTVLLGVHAGPEPAAEILAIEASIRSCRDHETAGPDDLGQRVDPEGARRAAEDAGPPAEARPHLEPGRWRRLWRPITRWAGASSAS